MGIRYGSITRLSIFMKTVLLGKKGILSPQNCLKTSFINRINSCSPIVHELYLFLPLASPRNGSPAMCSSSISSIRSISPIKRMVGCVNCPIPLRSPSSFHLSGHGTSCRRHWLVTCKRLAHYLLQNTLEALALFSANVQNFPHANIWKAIKQERTQIGTQTCTHAST